eukprot:SAG11_NODE_1153_length_5662_cov_51.111810_1_plen_77_part_00
MLLPAFCPRLPASMLRPMTVFAARCWGVRCSRAFGGLAADQLIEIEGREEYFKENARYIDVFFFFLNIYIYNIISP